MTPCIGMLTGARVFLLLEAAKQGGIDFLCQLEELRVESQEMAELLLALDFPLDFAKQS